MMYGSPEARICPSWCCTQKSQALRIRPTSSLGRLACTWRKSDSNLSSIAWGSAKGWVRWPASAVNGGALEFSAGMVWRTVAMLHYRPDAFGEHKPTTPVRAAACFGGTFWSFRSAVLPLHGSKNSSPTHQKNTAFAYED